MTYVIITVFCVDFEFVLKPHLSSELLEITAFKKWYHTFFMTSVFVGTISKKILTIGVVSAHIQKLHTRYYRVHAIRKILKLIKTVSTRWRFNEKLILLSYFF